MYAIKLFRYTLLGCFILIFSSAKAQRTPYLERLVTIAANKQTLADIFKTISVQTEVVFSYSQGFNDKQLMSYVCKNKPLRLVLNSLLQPSNCSYKVKEKYIIITCNKAAPASLIKMNGYIYNALDSLVIPNASVYIKQNKQSAITNNFGYFEMEFSNKTTRFFLSVAKEGYRDTTLLVSSSSKQEFSIYLNAKTAPKALVTHMPDTLVSKQDSLVSDSIVPKAEVTSEVASSFWTRIKSKDINFRNISDTLFTNFSISALPNIGTNRLLSINTVNKYSFNVLAGYSKGVDVFELGGLVNIDNGDVKYGQVAGLVNLVSGNVTGFQLGGIANLNSKQTNGLQIGGIVNVNKAMVLGMQLGGICNYTQGVKGVQLAGIYNQTNSIMGMQLGGIYNHAQKAQGLQLAGIVNTADTVNGVQFSGILNKAGYVKGMQFSLLNVADTFAGMPFGFFSYVKKGYHTLELASDEMRFASISFGTGVNALHNIFILGINYSKPQLLTYGYGLGSDFALQKKWNVSIELTGQQFQNTSYALSLDNLSGKVFVGIAYKIKPKLKLGFGPTYNVFSSNTGETNSGAIFENIPPYYFYNQDSGDRNTKMWIGAKLYLKIL
jgi:hypothetical protein